jgi:hypothetical protein
MWRKPAGVELAELRATGGSPAARSGASSSPTSCADRVPGRRAGSAAGAALLRPRRPRATVLRRRRGRPGARRRHRSPWPDAARFYRRLLPAFARTAEAVEGLNAWRVDEAPDGLAHTATGQASKEEFP